ncbi:hypothetical protein AN964_25000 [Heyndrickxia shackletonii]|uniref:Uncharacterized protein n=1 Tax=Heyndrickxia shackletonii TaxID=157838 RepID=A0A0Q3T9X9_9BACI|nr:hypothetical protein AN964_25000 [Heyndrickxia shackletonii]
MKKLNNYYSFVFLSLSLLLVILMKIRYVFIWNSFRYIFFWVNNLGPACLLLFLGIVTLFLIKKPKIRWIALIGNAAILLFVLGYTALMVILINNNPNPK